MCTLLACQLVDTRMIRVGCRSESVRAMGEGGRREREREKIGEEEGKKVGSQGKGR